MTPRSQREHPAPSALARLSIVMSVFILAALAVSFFTAGQRLLAVMTAIAAAILFLAIVLAEIGRRS